MIVFNIVLFLIYTYGIGYSLTRFLKGRRMENIIMRIAIGLGSIPLIGVILNLCHIPIDWRIFLVLALMMPLYDLCNKRWHLKLSLKTFIKDKFILLAILIFLANLFIFCKGAFVYPWLEDDDSWTHAAGVKYIATEKNLNPPDGEFQYLNPYPPGYEIIIAVLHQTDPLLQRTLKFFNSFIIALGFLFFYLFIEKLTNDKKRALLSTGFLACIPCYLTHFIWAHSLVITLFWAAFYLLLLCREDKRFLLSASIVISGIFLTQPTQSIKFVILALILIFVLFLSKQKHWSRLLLCLFIGTFLSLSWWGPKLLFTKMHSAKIATRQGNIADGEKAKVLTHIKESIFSPTGGSATRAYSFSDYFISEDGLLMNSPTGIGQIFVILSLLGLVISLFTYRSSSPTRKIACLSMFLWLIFTFLGMNSQTFHLPIGLFAFRFWTLFAVPVVFFSSEAFLGIFYFFEDKSKRMLSSIILLAFIILTSGVRKYDINTRVWHAGVYWNSYSEIFGYADLKKTLPANTKVFAFTDNLFVIGVDMHADYWSDEYKESFSDAINLPVNLLANRLKKLNYEYLIIGERSINKFGSKAINQKLQEIIKSPSFSQVHKTSAKFWLFRVEI